MQVRLGAALVAEFVGSFALTFVGIMAIHWSNGSLLAVALAHGIILAVMVSACMPTSGGHINPAITIGFLMTGKIKPVAGIAYIVIQLIGGVVAALAVLAIFGPDTGDGGGQAILRAGTPNLNANFTPMVGLLGEIIATFFLAFAVWGSAADPRARNVGGFAIGLAIAADILALGPLTGASMNPQRSFGPTLVAGDAAIWHNHWIYWVGPIVGAGLAALIYHIALWPREPRLGLDAPAMDVPPTQRP